MRFDKPRGSHWCGMNGIPLGEKSNESALTCLEDYFTNQFLVNEAWLQVFRTQNADIV